MPLQLFLQSLFDLSSLATRRAFHVRRRLCILKFAKLDFAQTSAEYTWINHFQWMILLQQFFQALLPRVNRLFQSLEKCQKRLVRISFF